MVVKEYDYIKSSTVAQPKRKISEPERKQFDELQRAKKRRKRRKAKQEQNRRKAALQIALIIFVFGTISIARDSKVYSMQKQVTKISQEIKLLDDENEAIRVDLLKVASLENIRTSAEEKHGMVVATKENMVPVDFSTNYFEELDKEDAKEDKVNTNLFSRLMDALK